MSTLSTREKESTGRAELRGRVALVTGGGSGVGRAIAKLFAARGAAVVVVDLITDRVNQVVNEVRASGNQAAGMTRDISKKDEVEQMIDDAIKVYGRLDILCNNAGIMDRATPAVEVTDELWERVINTNLNSAFWSSRKTIPIMVKQGGGSIINTDSVAGLFGGRAGTAYTVSKHGMIGLTKSIAAEYGSKGVRCNAMVLGGVNTAIGMGGEPNPAGMELLQKTVATLPRMGEPDEVAKLALFLASDDSSFVNGSCIVIDAGWTAI